MIEFDFVFDWLVSSEISLRYRFEIPCDPYSGQIEFLFLNSIEDSNQWPL